MPLKTTAGHHGAVAKGRGASINPEGRFEIYNREAADDGWFQEPAEGEAAKPKTVIAIEKAKSVISRHNSPDLGFSQSINPYRGCSHGCSYCAWGGTPILMADGQTRRLDQLRVGDEIVGTKQVGSQRRYVRSRVLAHWSTIKPAFEILLDDGTRLITSADHRFLTDSGWKHVLDSRETGNARPHLSNGDVMFGAGAAPRAMPQTSVRQNGSLLEIVEHAPGTESWAGRIFEGGWATALASLRVRSVRPLGGAMRLFDITTSTEDFIANGVVSHNCFARPSHAYLGLSPGLDFETRLSAKTNAAEKLREEFANPRYRCEPLTIGVNTDAYQPIEKEYRITRSILEVASETHHPVSLITKNAMIERDLDILAPMAKRRLVNVTISITTLSNETSRHMEPRASAPMRRLLAVKRLSEAGIPVAVNVAPVVPFLTDSELEPIMEAAAAHGAYAAHYTLVRLPWEVKDIFRAWLEEHFPLKAAHVMSRIHEMREGRDNDPDFGTRMVGTGLFAELLRQRFDKALKRFGLDQREAEFGLDTTLFIPPALHGQKTLF